MQGVSHSVFVVETVAWVGPRGQDRPVPEGLLFCGRVPRCRMGSTRVLNARRRWSSWPCFGWRWARWKALGFTQPTEVQRRQQVKMESTVTVLILGFTVLPSYRGGRDNSGPDWKDSCRQIQLRCFC